MKGESEKFSSMWWKDLCLSCGEGDVSSWVNRSFVWKLGEGDQARFWLDNWGSEECFASKFQRLFGLSLQQFEVVKKVGEWRKDRWVWNLSWRKGLLRVGDGTTERIDANGGGHENC